LIAPGKTLQVIVIIVSFVLLIFSIRRAKAGKVPKIRKIACLEALPELVGRCAEKGAPLHFATGFRGLDTSEAAIVTAGYAMLGHAAELCGKYKVPIHYTCVYGYNIPIAQDLIKSGYLKAGHPELYREDMVTYVGESQIPYMAALMGYIMREKPAANMLFGGIMWETLNTLGAAAIAGCMQAAGTPRMFYQPFLVASCDYSMIGDELFAAAAMVRGTPDELGGIEGTDFLKMAFLVLAIIAVALLTAGSKWFLEIARR